MYGILVSCLCWCSKELLDKLQKRILRTVGSSFASFPKPFVHRWSVASLNFFYRDYFGRCLSDRESSYQLRQTLALFQISSFNFRLKVCLKSLRVRKVVKQIIFKGVWDESEARKSFQRQSFTKYLGHTLVFMWNSALRGKFNFCFSGDFY